MAALRTQGFSHIGAVGYALRRDPRVSGPQTLRGVDVLADSLTQFVISYTPDNGINRSDALSVVNAISLSAGAEGEGQPYAGAGEHLLRIVDSAYRPFRAAALNGFVGMANSAEGLRFLRRVATSSNSVAAEAVSTIHNRMGADGLTVLRELHRGNAVVEPRGRRQLTAIAKANGWEP